MAGLPFNSVPIYTAATTTPAAAPPPPTLPDPITTPDPIPTVPDTPNRQKTQQTPLYTTCFRLLCHTSRVGGVIGKQGSVIKQLQEATSAKIIVEDSPFKGSEYRVIKVVADSLVNKTMSFEEDGVEETNGCVEIGSEYCEVSTAQEALVRVFERILSVAAEADGCYYAPGGVVSCKLLTSAWVVGFVIGKGGKVVEKIKKDTRCKIRVFSQERLPGGTMPADEMVEIEGGVVGVTKALVAVSRRIQDCPPSDRSRVAFGKPDNRFNRDPNGHVDQYPLARPHNGFNPVSPNRHMDHFPLVQEPAPTGYAQGFGNGGTVVRAFENQTGAHISVAYPVPGCAERLITITASESPESQNSPAQNAVILVFSRCVETAYAKGLDSPSSGTPITARLVIPHYQTGCLLGRGGLIMEDMRKVTGAFIRIVSGNNFPGCASETDEVVLMKGEFVNVRDALYSVTTRLRNHLFTGGTKTNRRGTGQPPFDLTQSMHNLTFSNNLVDHPSSSGPWLSQSEAGNMMNGHDVDRGSTSGKSGVELGRGGRSAIITNTTFEIMVPHSDIGFVYGENGSNLTRIRQISGARVVVHEPGSREGDYVVVISGTPDQTQSAQSLLQAFMLADQH